MGRTATPGEFRGFPYWVMFLLRHTVTIFHGTGIAASGRFAAILSAVTENRYGYTSVIIRQGLFIFGGSGYSGGDR
jgi:hypothetical protein